MTNKEICEEMWKMIEAVGLNVKSLTLKRKQDDKLFPIAKIERKDIYQLKRDLELLELYKKLFKYSLTEIQGIKYLTLPNSGDIRRPDSMIKITDEEYETLKRGLENDK